MQIATENRVTLYRIAGKFGGEWRFGGLYYNSQIKIRQIFYSHIPYPRERGPMGGAPYIVPRLGDGPIFDVSVSRLYSKERPGKLPTLAS